MDQLLSKSVEIARFTMRGDRKGLMDVVDRFRSILKESDLTDEELAEVDRLLNLLVSTAARSKTTCPARKIATQIVSIFHQRYVRSQAHS